MAEVDPAAPARTTPDTSDEAEATAASASRGVPPTLVTWAGITWRILIILAGLVALLYVMGLVAVVLIALFLAAFFTALARPIMKLLNRVMPKIIALILSIILIAVAAIVVIGIVLRSIIQEGPALSTSVTNAFNAIQDWLQNGPLQLTDDDVSQYVTDIENWARESATAFAGDVFGSLGTLVIGGSVFIFAVIFFMSQPERVWGFVVNWMPDRARPYVNTSGDIAWGALSGYARGMVVVAIADSILVFIGLTILQVPLAPALAAIVFFGAFIPVIGAPIATFFAAIIALAERGPLIALLVVLLTVVVGSFDGDVLQPLVMGKAVSLSPLAIIILIAIGSITLGIVGALIAVPIGSAIYGVLKYLTGRDPDHPLHDSPPPEQPPPSEPTPSEPPASQPAAAQPSDS